MNNRPQRRFRKMEEAIHFSLYNLQGPMNASELRNPIDFANRIAFRVLMSTLIISTIVFAWKNF
jgi:hypothetical protein